MKAGMGSSYRFDSSGDVVALDNKIVSYFFSFGSFICFKWYTYKLWTVRGFKKSYSFLKVVSPERLFPLGDAF